MNSNELNERILDACLDPACFQILYAYIKLGGWDTNNEVYLSRTHYQKWGIKKRTLSEHRKHLIEAGWLVPTGNKSEAGFDKFTVTAPPVQNQHDPLAEFATPPSRICTTPVQDLPTEVIKNNEVSNETSKERSAVADAPSLALQENKNDKDDSNVETILIGSNTPGLIALPTTGGAGPVDRWKTRQGLTVRQHEEPEWMRDDYKPVVKKKVTVPELEW